MSTGERRRKRNRTAYSKSGVYSMLFMLVSLVLLWAAVFVPILWKKLTLSISGGLGIMVLILSVCGIQCARKGMREPEVKHANCIVGVIGCILAFVVSFAIYLGGL